MFRRAVRADSRELRVNGLPAQDIFREATSKTGRIDRLLAYLKLRFLWDYYNRAAASTLPGVIQRDGARDRDLGESTTTWRPLVNSYL